MIANLTTTQTFSICESGNFYLLCSTTSTVHFPPADTATVTAKPQN